MAPFPSDNALPTRATVRPPLLPTASDQNTGGKQTLLGCCLETPDHAPGLTPMG